jgi:hypothetical protein
LRSGGPYASFAMLVCHDKCRGESILAIKMLVLGTTQRALWGVISLDCHHRQKSFLAADCGIRFNMPLGVKTGCRSALGLCPSKPYKRSGKLAQK